MSIFAIRSIRTKLILLFTATASLTVLLACNSLWVYQLLNYRENLQIEERATAQLIADTSGPALLFDDATAATETLSFLRTDPRIRLACLYDKQGKLVANFVSTRYTVGCPAAYAAKSLFDSHYLYIVRPIEVKGEAVGQLYLVAGFYEMYVLLFHLGEAGLCVLLLSTLFALGLSSFLERFISRPIIDLTAVATKVSSGGNLMIRANRGSNDETGVLIDQFNVMMDHLQQREADLQSARHGLESKVQKRTIDLSNEIAERKIIELDLMEAKRIAEESNQAKSSFLANMSHELRTPLNAIIGYSEMLHEDAVSTGSAEVSDDLAKVLFSARHLLTLISDILDISKIEAGEMKLYPEIVSSSEVLDDMVATAEVLVRTNRNKFVLVEPVWRGVMLIDALRFRQCMLNLIGNACKFTQDGTISIAVKQRVVAEKSWIQWSVQDTGVGISSAEQATLFQTFLQGDSSATRRHGGSGLGLAISQQLCSDMGGHITVHSLINEGSTFTIFIPDELSVRE